MAKSTSLNVPQLLKNPAAVLNTASSFIAANPGTSPTNVVTVLTAGADDASLKSLLISTDDSAVRKIAFYYSIDSGTTKHLLGTVNVPALSGSDGTLANVDVLGNALLVGLPLDLSGKPYLPLQSGMLIYAGVITAAITASKTVWITAGVEQF